MTKKKSEPNPIEEAIGERAKDLKAQKKFTEEYQTEPTPEPNSPPKLSEIPDEPTPSEMLTLEELNRQTEERLQDNPEEPTNQKELRILNHAQIVTGKEILVSKPDHPPQEVKTCSLESPAKKIETETKELPPLDTENELLAQQQERLEQELKSPVEDIELVALRKYIQEDGFVLATVAFHIVTLCAQPMVTPSTTTWDFRDRASVPDMVLALLNQPGYLESIWPSLKIIMSDNKGNAAWCAGISTTIAFFDTIRVLPALEELKQCSEMESK